MESTKVDLPHQASRARWVVRLSLVVLFLSIASSAPAQQQSTELPKTQDDNVVRVRSNLVNFEVIVKDKKGKYVSDLRAEDFTVTENGVPQKIEFFDAPLVRTGDKNTAGDAKVDVVVQPPPTPTAPRNYVSLVLDWQTTDITNSKQVREGIIKYVREQVTDGDAVALFSITNGLQMVQSFTQDKSRLIAALEKMESSPSSKNFEQKDLGDNISMLRNELSSSGAPSPGSITSSAGGSAAANAMIAATVLQQFIKLRTALSLQQSRPILAALAAICEGLRPIPGKKTVVLFSQGFVTPAVLDWQVQSTIDIANRANVAVYIIDSAGLRGGGTQSGALVPAGPLAGVSAITNQEQRIRAVGGDTVFDNVRHEGQNREYDILYRISGDTGGKFLKGNNDIGQGLERINQEIQARYTIAYRSSNQNFDGTFRKVKIEVQGPSQIISRAGYYAIPPEEVVLFSPADKKLLANFSVALAKPEIPVFASLNPFRAQEGLYTVPLAIELPPSAVTFDRKGEKRTMQLEVLGVLKATPNTILSRLGGNFDVTLTAAEYGSILSNNIFYRQDLQLAPGEYTIDLVVRDKQSGKTAAQRLEFELGEPDSEFATSAVVLSRYVEPARPLPPNSAEPADVLTSGKTSIRPSSARQFRASDNLIMFLAVYNAVRSAESAKPLVRVTARIMKDGKPVTKPFDYVLTEVQREPVDHLQFAEYMRLTGLAPGNYQAIIEVKDMVSRKLVKQEVPFAIVK